MDAVMSQSQQKNQLKPKSNFLDAQEQLNMLLSNGIESMAANSKRKSSKDGRQPEVGGRTRNTMNPQFSELTLTKTRQSKGSVTRIKKSKALKQENVNIEPTVPKPRSKSQKKLIEKSYPSEHERGLVKKIKMNPSIVSAEHIHHLKTFQMNSIATLPPAKDKSKVDQEPQTKNKQTKRSIFHGSTPTHMKSGQARHSQTMNLEQNQLAQTQANPASLR